MRERQLAASSAASRVVQVDFGLPAADVVDSLGLQDLPEFLGHVRRLEAAGEIRLHRLALGTSPHLAHADHDRLLTVEEVAQRTGFSTSYVYHHRGALPFMKKIGRSLRGSERDLNRWLETRRHS